MDENISTRMIMECKKEGVRSRGHLKLRWMDGLDDGLKKL